jgi:hypothetical protein
MITALVNFNGPEIDVTKFWSLTNNLSEKTYLYLVMERKVAFGRVKEGMVDKLGKLRLSLFHY